MRSVWLAIILCLGLSIPAHAATLFTENFEVATLADLRAKGWHWIGPLDGDSWSSPGVCRDYCAMSLVSSTSLGAAPHGGSKMILLEYRGLHQNDNHNQRLIRTVPASPEFYARYWFRTEVNTKKIDGSADPNAPTQSGYSSITGKQHYLKTDGTSPDGYPNFVTNHFFGSRELEFTTQGGADLGSSNDRRNMGSGPLQDNRWYCIEYHIKMNTPDVSNGVQEVWIDGAQTLGYYTRKFRNAAHANAALTEVTVYRQGSEYMNRYEDDFVMATTRVGCSGNPSADTTPPTAPIGLTFMQ